MKNMKYILGLMFAMPFCAWATDGAQTNIGTMNVPFGRIYDAVTSFPDLYETNFVKLLDNKTTYTLGEVAQACVNFTKHSNGKVDNKKCQDFVRSVIDRSNFIASTTEEDFVVTTTETTEFKFYIYASGKFYVDCNNDGKFEHEIGKTDTNREVVTCKYDQLGQYEIKITGDATGYPNCTERATKCSAISFASNTNLYSIRGSLGSVFPTLSNGVQPKFNGTFEGCENLTGPIPPNLFAGISGQPVAHMFGGTFNGCKNLNRHIPSGLFAGLSGAPAKDMFLATFEGCENLGGEIPSDLFAGISGVPAEGMFRATFKGCKKLDGEIPKGLFGKLSGAPAEDMFRSTFNGCEKLDGEIPSDLFAGISGVPAKNMFYFTFNGCAGLDGEIPSDLFAGISGVPAEGMFSATFQSCSGLTSIPSGLFGNLSGAPAKEMFDYTFFGCTNLRGPSATIGEQFLYQIWPDATFDQVGKMYRGCGNLDDFEQIPDTWK